MKITEFVKKELQGWKNYEIIGLFLIIVFILASAFLLNDSKIAVCSAICGILYTIIAGKGKISCYFFGLLGSGCYIWLSFNNALWGNMLLYLCYYIPMQILGIFRWRKHLKAETNDIVKIRLKDSDRLKILFLGIFGSVITAFILAYFNDKSPIIDGITTFMSILGMYFTVKRAIEQWMVWMIVNGLSFLMWLNLFVHGAKTFSTVVMWGVYFILAIYFYVVWKKELSSVNEYNEK